MTLEEWHEELKQEYYEYESTYRAVQHISRQKCRRYDHEFLERWGKEYLNY